VTKTWTYEDKLKVIAEKAKQDKKLKFTSLAHLVNESSLAQSYKKLNKASACGSDRVTVGEYGSNLASNIATLHNLIRTKKYKPKAVRRSYIPKKGRSGMRPLGLPSVEDKLVQMVLKEILEAIFEADFLETSHGFRPGKSCHTAIKELNNEVMKKATNYVVEVDIKKFFDTVNHKWLYEMLRQRISDPVFLGMIWKILRAGVMENNKVTVGDDGTPQGGIVSPILANIYLHYVLDLWFEIEFKKRTKGYVKLIRYCDDFVMVCESKQDAIQFLQELKERLAKFYLEISEEKTQIIKFGRNPWKQANKTGEKVKSFDFLGFTHFCKASRKGWFVMGHKTSKKRLADKLKSFSQWLRTIRNLYPMRVWWKLVKAKLIGYYNYFGINGNMRCLRQYYMQVKSICFKWINRRSQKKSMNWKQYTQHLQWNPLPEPRIYHRILYTMPK
jgi:RNA-directed DNA polymerase